MKSQDQLMKALRRIEGCLLSEYELRAQGLTDAEPLQAALRDAINISRTARGHERMEPHDS